MVLLGFTGFSGLYQQNQMNLLVLLGLTALFLDITSYYVRSNEPMRFSWITRFYLVSLGFTGFYWVILDFTGFFLGLTGFDWV